MERSHKIPVSEQQPHCVAPIKCVAKTALKKIRLIHDLRLVNHTLNPEIFVNERIAVVQNLLSSGDLGITVDVTEGVYHASAP